MAREIDLEKELNDTDRQYLAERDRWHSIARADGHEDPDRAKREYENRATAPTQPALPPTDPQAPARTLEEVGGTPGGGPGDGDEEVPYEEWTYPELQAELKERGLAAGGKQPELVQRLYDHDEQEAAKAQQ